MHRLTFSTLAVFASLSSIALAPLALTGCGKKKPAEDATSAAGDKAEGDPASAAEGGDKDKDKKEADGAPKKDECTGFDIANLEDALSKSSCEVTNAKAESVTPVDMKGKLEVSVGASPTKIAPGGKADLVVTFANKSKEPLTLNFRIDPTARFDVEVFDAKKNKRADLPGGNPPPPPKGHAAPPATEAKVAHVTLAPNGTARSRIAWEAVKMRWAPEKVRGTPPERGYPRAPAGPLAKGKYTVKVVTPLVGVTEGGEHEVSAPKVEIDIGG